MLNPANITARSLVVLVGLLGATACSGDDIRWTEEVRLHDGKVIQLKRRTELTDLMLAARTWLKRPAA